MKNLITIIIMLVAAGCGKSEIETKTETKTETETGKTEKKPLSPEEKLVGSYEAMSDRGTFKVALFENGKLESYKNGRKKEATWKIVGNEVHIGNEKEAEVLKIEPNGDLTAIAKIKEGKRQEAPKEFQIPLKKVSKSEPLSPEEMIVGSYENNFEEETIKLVLLENGKGEIYRKEEKGTWKISGKEVHVDGGKSTSVWKIEPNGDLTLVAAIVDGKREDSAKIDRQQVNDPVVGYAGKSSEEYALGVRPGDIFQSINGEKVESWQDIIYGVLDSTGPTVKTVLLQGDREVTVNLPANTWNGGIRRIRLDNQDHLEIQTVREPSLLASRRTILSSR